MKPITIALPLALCVSTFFLAGARAQSIGSNQALATLSPEQRRILSHMSLVLLDDGAGGHVETIRISGVNLQIVNGLEATNGYPADPATFDDSLTRVNGAGNLIVGYNEADSGSNRTGSHCIVVGRNNDYASFAGVVCGTDNNLVGPASTVCGGFHNTAQAVHSAILGGEDNETAGPRAAIGGGLSNRANAFRSFVGGGQLNSANATHSSIAGGHGVETTGEFLTGVGPLLINP